MLNTFLKQNRIAAIIFVLILLQLTPLKDVYAEDIKEQKTVLIISSYNQDFTWSKDVTDGIINTLRNSGYNLSTYIEYMDWKNYPTDKNLQFLYDYYKYKYQNKKIDLLITVDDAAAKFALKNREELFSNAPVVFCGLNQEGVSQITGGYNNVTGVLEEIDPTDTMKMALSIDPSLKNVYILFDNSESGLSAGKLTINRIESMNRDLDLIPLNSLSYDALIKNVKSFDKNSIIIFTTYYSDVNNKIVEYEDAAREISKNSSVPVYCLYDLGLNNGALGGVMTGGLIHGKSAADLAIRIFRGESPDDIPVLAPLLTRKVLDYQQLIRFNISLNAIPKDSELINKPFSFFETYKILVLSVISAFTILTLFAGILLFYIAKIRRMRKLLFESHEELTQTYEELTASDEELQQQFEEISGMQGKLSKSEERFRIATDGSDAIIWDLDMLTMQYHFSDRWYELLGYEKNEVDEVNGGWKSMIHPDDSIEAEKARSLHLEGKTPFYNIEYRLKRKNGNYLWFNVRGQVLQDKDGKNIRFAGSMINVTERKKFETKLQESLMETKAAYEKLTATQEELKQQYDEIFTNHEKIKVTEERLAYLAYHDTLTGLPNKLSLYENSQVHNLLPKDGQSALLFIDIDHFKYINDTMGHAFGDRLITSVSERLTLLLKNTCVIFRLSGDEFIIISKDMKEEEVEKFAAHILEGFKEEFNVSDSVLHINLSIGITFYPKHGKNIEELLKYADIAMYKAKEAGRKGYIIYNQIMNEAFIDRANIEKYLHTALEKNEFELHCQPQLDLKSKKITGFEVLLRWNSPELGLVSPLKFISVAEDTHLIIPLGTWVLREACDFLKKLHNMNYSDLSVSVNISVLQLLQTDFSEIVINTLETFELNPEDLELEITESILMESYETIGPKLDNLSKSGIRIALDDFGKGYSSLSYLKQLPISTLKIDKSFIDNISDDGNVNPLIGQIVMMGKSMGMCVIAEGVEREEQLDYLTHNECDKIQGFLFSKPITEKEFTELLKVKA